MPFIRVATVRPLPPLRHIHGFQGPFGLWRVGLGGQSPPKGRAHNLHPEWIATIPPDRLRQPVFSMPASPIIAASVG